MPPFHEINPKSTHPFPKSPENRFSNLKKLRTSVFRNGHPNRERWALKKSLKLSHSFRKPPTRFQELTDCSQVKHIFQTRLQFQCWLISSSACTVVKAPQINCSLHINIICIRICVTKHFFVQEFERQNVSSENVLHDYQKICNKSCNIDVRISIAKLDSLGFIYHNFQSFTRIWRLTVLLNFS